MSSYSQALAFLDDYEKHPEKYPLLTTGALEEIAGASYDANEGSNSNSGDLMRKIWGITG